MSINRADLLVANRPIDLATIDAIGFDLDHTLAIYDDAAVNEIAASAARRLLVDELGYPPIVLRGAPAVEAPAAARTLALDLVDGTVVKLDAERRALRARRGGRWLDRAEIATRSGRPLGDERHAAYTVYSPFELPVLWLLEELEVMRPPHAGSPAARCEDVRRMLDVAHTNGVLKDRLREDLPRFVSGIAGIGAGLERWARAGKKLFIVTNSEPLFASAVLDHTVGLLWRDVFEVVVTSARKPAFFVPGANTAAYAAANGPGRALILEGGNASRVEAALGIGAERILFVGDNAQSDIRAARFHGWRTAHVVPELAFDQTAQNDGWGAPLAHDGRPTWLAHLARGHTDIACDHAGRLLELDPNAALAGEPRPAPRGETP
jgi:5'-nucleotidase